MSNPLKRLLTAIIAVPILYIIFLLGGVIYLLFFLVLIVVGQVEYQKLLESKNLPNEKILGIISSLLMGITAYLGYYYFTFCFTAIVLVILILDLRKGDFSQTVTNIGATLFGVIYLGWLLSHAILLRNIDQYENIKTYALNNQGISDLGFFLVVFAVACTFLNDTGAYYTGTLIGKHKLAPKISPGKTIEGTIGGIVVCIISGLIVNYLFGNPLSSDWTIAFALLVAIAAILGDLVESSIKRGAGIKDSGDIVPGHGGVLDRFDSLIFVFPVSYYFIILYYSLHGAI
ncbi:MAG: phosphatidate cytidylyltransferase [Thermodesulfobacteriota bacterium]|nr:MAG: phosphatidate cytidylyltransferase [Thermodesulfobacteriota bacterium]